MFQQWHTSIENSGTEGKEGGGGGGLEGKQDLVSFVLLVITVPLRRY